MADLKTLNDQVAASIAKQDGSWQARQEMLDAIDRLRIAALGPAEFVVGLRYQALQNMGISMALEMKLLPPIVERKGSPITAQEIAAASGSDGLLTVRILRLLSALHLVTEVSALTYVSNANTQYLNHPSRIAAHRFLNTPTLKVMANAVPFMRANNGAFTQFPDRSKNEVGLAQFTHGLALWDFFRTDPESLQDFSDYLAGRREEVVGHWFDIWPAKSKITAMLDESPDDERVLVVDVGGNVGYDLLAFHQRFPEFEGKGALVLQDLPENIKNARTPLERKGIQATEYDFFTPQPIQGARIYYFGAILHDWSDTESLKILHNVAAAMAPDSRIIIDENMLPDENAPLNMVQYDLLMMINVTGIERTIGHYKELLDKAGLELVDVWRTSLDSVLEIKLKG